MKLTPLSIPSRKNINKAVESTNEHIRSMFADPAKSKPVGTSAEDLDADEKTITEAFAQADIRVNGERPWDIHIHDKRFYRRVLAHGTMGFGESFMEGWWDCADLEELCFRCIGAHLEEKLAPHVQSIVEVAFSGLMHMHDRKKAGSSAAEHYDLGNDFFAAMLDPAMQYSCAYFEGTSDLVIAQRLKMGLICQKLGIRPGMRVLDIGCGWGGLAKYAAEHFGCSVTGITLSENQKAYAEEACSGLSVEIRLQDYRDVSEPFDRIVSVGMLEHVGHSNYGKYMEVASRCLKPDGLFLCHTITGNNTRTSCDPWITRYIFPNSMLPSASRVLQASEGRFVLEDVQNLGTHYAPTLAAWERAFSNSCDQFRARYGEKFIRMWRLYLLSCAGAFRARSLQVLQFLFSKSESGNMSIASAIRSARNQNIPDRYPYHSQPGLTMDEVMKSSGPIAKNAGPHGQEPKE